MASPSGAAGSGAEGSSGDSGGSEPAGGRHLPALFEQAAERLPGLLGAASKEQLLYLYARYKQVRPRPAPLPHGEPLGGAGRQQGRARHRLCAGRPPAGLPVLNPWGLDAAPCRMGLFVELH